MVSEDNMRVSVTVPKFLVEIIDRHRRYRSRSAFICAAIIFYLTENYGFGKSK